jgi:hypothetical protein
MNDRKWRLKKDLFRRRLDATVKTYEALRLKTGLSMGTITNVITGGCRYEITEKIASFGLDMGEKWTTMLVEEDRRRLNDTPEGVYPVAWQDLVVGAQEVGRKLFRDQGVNTILTFPGPSLIFAGLTMAETLSREEIVRIPTHVAIFAEKNAPRTRSPQFDAIPMERFTVLIPRTLLQHDHGRDKRIGVIDDVILTGRVMDALRNYFSDLREKPASVAFACYICHEGRTLIPETTPICKLSRPEKIFRMPWGDASAFEHCFESPFPGPAI